MENNKFSELGLNEEILKAIDDMGFEEPSKIQSEVIPVLRVLDLIRRDVIDLSNINFLVLDEADEMLNMGFIDDIEEIVKNSNKERQTMLFSATMPEKIKRLAKRYMKPETKHVAIMKNAMTVTFY